MNGKYFLFFAFFVLLSSFVSIWISEIRMRSRIFAIEVASDDVDVELLAKRMNCQNQGIIANLPGIYQFRYNGSEENPIEWMKNQSGDDIKWIEEQAGRRRYHRDL
jgi:hypothetical protein